MGSLLSTKMPMKCQDIEITSLLGTTVFSSQRRILVDRQGRLWCFVGFGLDVWKDLGLQFVSFVSATKGECEHRTARLSTVCVRIEICR
jgi:hypothetical protein